MSKVRIFVPGSIGNVGPGFDVLGLAIADIGDIFEMDLVSGDASVEVEGRHADDIPTDPDLNCCTIAARALLKAVGDPRQPRVKIIRRLPFAGGLGASAASSVGGAFGAAMATGKEIDQDLILRAALAGEAAVAGAHLDNIAPSLLGGLCVCYGLEPPRVTSIAIKAPWWLTLLTPNVRMPTKQSRMVLPETSSQAEWTAQMGLTAALVTAFINGDVELARLCLRDPFAEPRRKATIPHFDDVKARALEAGAIGVSISGAGPTIFALCPDEKVALRCAETMPLPFEDEGFSIHVTPIASQGAQQV